MEETLKKALDSKSKFHDRLLTECKQLVDYSRAHMHKHYEMWDVNDETLRGKRLADEADKKAVSRGEPAKLTMPLTYAQAQTFIAFMCMMFSQREIMYEIEGSGREDVGTPERDAQRVLQADVRDNRFELLKYQNFRDLVRCGFCVSQSMWMEDSFEEAVQTPTPDAFGFGRELVANTTRTSYRNQRNKIKALSPYRFFPDVRLPLCDFQEGEFCASEQDYTTIALKKLQVNGQIVNVDEIEKLDERMLEKRRTSFPNNLERTDASSGMAIITQILRWIVPADYEDEENGTNPLGDSKEPQLYVIWYANDKTILKAELANVPYNQFPYDLGEFSPDHIHTINESLAEIVGPLQDVCSWFLNSHITSVRKNIDNKLVIDPAGVNMEDIKSRSPVIRIKDSMGTRGIDSWIKQLNVTDVTQGHVSDLQVLWQFMQTATGISENALGQYNGGRRSAYEARTVNSGAASRLKMIASILWETYFIPMGKKSLTNLQKLLTFEEFKKRVGDDADEARYQAFVAGSDHEYNFSFFDGTAPSEKGYMAQSMQELFLGLLSNPGASLMLQQEPFRTLVIEIAELRGIRQPSRLLPPLQPTQPNAITDPTQPNPGGLPGGSPAPAVGVPQ